MIYTYIFLGIALLLIFYVIITYNKLVRLRIGTQEAWSSVEVQLKKRFDLIPNLVETVKGYATHEKGVFENVAAFRSGMNNAHTVEEQAKIQGEISGMITRIMAVAENYPELKANANFTALQKELSTIEEGIEMSRRYYNGATRNNNISVEVFPTNIIANLFNFTKVEFFEIENSEERNTPQVKF